MMKKKKKKSAPKVRMTQYAREEAAQAADEHLANLTAAAASAYSLPPPAPAAALLMSEDPLVAANGMSDAHKCCDGATSGVCLGVQAMGEKAIKQRVPEALPADPVVTNIRGSNTSSSVIHLFTRFGSGDGRCHVAAIQAAKNGLEYWISVSRFAMPRGAIHMLVWCIKQVREWHSSGQPSC